MKTEQKTIESREENEFICLHLNGSTSDDGLAAGLADGLVVGRRCVGGGHLAVVQRRASINFPLLANFCIYSGNSSMLKFGTHGTQPGVPIQAAVYKQRGNHRERERQPKQSINRKAIIYKWSCFHL